MVTLLPLWATEIVEPMAGLISRARDHDDVDLIYVNDNFGNFTADFDEK